MLRFIFCLFFIYCFCENSSGQRLKLKRLKPALNITGHYTACISEQYMVDGTSNAGDKEKINSGAEIEITQDVLELHKNYFLSDYNIQHFSRYDTLTRSNNYITIDSNKGSCPLVKIILQYDKTGKFLGPVMEMNKPELNTRDFRYFYTTAKKIIFHIPDSINSKTAWHTQETDTILHSAFELVHHYTLQWKFVRWVDTLGMKCAALQYTSDSAGYMCTNSVMKALGLDMVHSGMATINGTVLVDKKTGRLVAGTETGSFDGIVTIKGPKEETTSPTTYSYRKTLVLTELEKLPRKKFLGIF